MIETTAIISIHNLKLKANTSIPLDNDVFLTNDIKLLEDIFNNENILKVLGLNEINFIKKNETFIFIKQKINIDKNEFDEQATLAKALLLSQILCQCFWLVKDNSIRTELGHLIYIPEKIKTTYIHSNIWSSFYSNCLGNNMHSIEFNLPELVQATSAFPILFTLLYVGNSLNSNAKLTSKQTRLARSLYFLQSARQSEDIGTKIAHYCSVLESLFSVSNSELRHRLSETVSLFLSNDKDEKIELYKKLQTAYDIRSSIVHGDGISDKFVKNEYKLLYTITQDIDNLIRRCFDKILRDENLIKLFTEKSREEVSNYIQNLIFS